MNANEFFIFASNMKALTYNNSEIRFGQLAESGFEDLLRSDRFLHSKKVIITDENVNEIWMEHILTHFESLKGAEIIELPSGEENKVIEICAQVWQALTEYEIGRNDLIINIGGGVITDMGGFIAATYKRGLTFINVPTTLLAQVDAYVGGKTGIDLGAHKNQIGVFADADYVFIDPNFLTTLPADEIKSGYAEMLKHGLITFKSYWSDLIKIDPCVEPENLIQKIRTSVSIKRDIVAQDHLETSVRKNLNFGHTIGHAIESYHLKHELPTTHGFCVAWGIVAESFISFQQKKLSQQEFEEINTTIRRLYDPISIPMNRYNELRELLQQDKKTIGGELQFTLLTKIGEAIHNQHVSEELIEAGFSFILNS